MPLATIFTSLEASRTQSSLPTSTPTSITSQNEQAQQQENAQTNKVKGQAKSNDQDDSTKKIANKVTEGTAGSNSLPNKPSLTNNQDTNNKFVSTGLLRQFENQFAALQNDQTEDDADREQYQRLYFQIRPVIAEKTKALQQLTDQPNVDLSLLSQWRNTEKFKTLVQRYQELQRYYQLREQIFASAPSALRDSLTSFRITGLEEAKLESQFVRLQASVLSKAAVQRTKELPALINLAPMDIFKQVLIIIIALYVFINWRRWAIQGLPQWRQNILAVRPRTSARIKVARAIWYLEQTRQPLEWLIFFYVIINALKLFQLPLLINVLQTIVFWLCLTSFAYTFLSKVIQRGKQNVLRNISSAQSVSLKTVIWWAGLFKLVTALTELVITKTTILGWLSTLFLTLLIPVYVFFIQSWRDDFFNYVDQERDAPQIVHSLLKNRRGIKGFLAAGFAFIFALYFSLSKKFLNLISKVESGRRITTEIYRKKLLNDNAQLIEDSKNMANLNEGVSDLLIHGNGEHVASIIEPLVEKIMAMVEQKERSHIAVIGERGIGKSHLLQTLTERHPKSLMLSCSEDFNDIIEQLKQQLNLDTEQSKSSDVMAAVKEQGIDLILLDNCHRLLTPEVSGQREMRRLYGWITDFKGQALWILSFDRSSWTLLNALGIASGFYASSIQMHSWSEEQICELFDQRCQQAGIDVDYSKLSIPKQLVDIEEDDFEARNKYGILRIIWGYAEGNPAIACRTLAQALKVDNKNVIAQIPLYPDNKIIEQFEINTLLVLRVICQFGRCSVNDIVKNLRLHGLVVNSAIAACVAQGILEQVAGRYQITWLWFRPVSKYLARQNLLPR
ncbi:ATP-binding protein [Thalassotalea maritima]|uniref:ATP-binding protein n=1 Tax=Thalassotalea maritima TaxID=3242416 RepID=UPI003528B074